MIRGEIWIAKRAGGSRFVIIVGHDNVTAQRDGVITIPISDVRSPSLIEPAVFDEGGMLLGVALTPRLGEVDKTYLTERHGRLGESSLDSVDIALRAVLDLHV